MAAYKHTHNGTAMSGDKEMPHFSSNPLSSLSPLFRHHVCLCPARTATKVGSGLGPPLGVVGSAVAAASAVAEVGVIKAHAGVVAAVTVL